MKKIKLLLVGVLCLSIILLTGCKKEEDGEIDYNAVYENGNMKVSTYKMKEMVYYFFNGKDFENNSSGELENNKVKLDIFTEDSYLTFNKGYITLDLGKNDFVKSGKYKKVGSFSKEDFFDFAYGDKELLNSEITGAYEKDKLKIYVFQNRKNSINVYYVIGESPAELEMEKNENGDYYLEFFEDIYTIKINSGKMTIDIKTNDEEKKVLNGEYTKTENLDIDQIMNIYTSR